MVEVCIQQGVCTAPHTLQYGISSPPCPMPHLLREMAGRWCHRFVCLVLTIDVYGIAHALKHEFFYKPPLQP